MRRTIQISLLLIILLVAFKPSLANKNEKSKYGDKRFNEWTWLTAHNAHINWHDSSVIEYARNQDLSLDKQLQHGVRAFMLDIDFKTCTTVESWFNTCPCEGVCLCHGKCAQSAGNSIKDGFAIKKFEYALRKLVKFLTKNPSEIITIILENYVEDSDKMHSVFNRVRHLTGLVFNPYSAEWNVTSKGWPLISDMIAANKRFLIVDYNLAHSRKEPGFIYPTDFFVENHWEWFHDEFEWPLEDISAETFSKVALFVNENMTSLPLEMARCVSVQKINRTAHVWDEERQLDLEAARRGPYDVANSEKLFLFNHFYGVSVRSGLVNASTVRIMNTAEFVMKRFEEKCWPATGFKKPNFIALDFISEQVYRDLIVPLNED